MSIYLKFNLKLFQAKINFVKGVQRGYMSKIILQHICISMFCNACGHDKPVNFYCD
jgi:hypothetical protein